MGKQRNKKTWWIYGKYVGKIGLLLIDELAPFFWQSQVRRESRVCMQCFATQIQSEELPSWDKRREHNMFLWSILLFIRYVTHMSVSRWVCWGSGMCGMPPRGNGMRTTVVTALLPPASFMCLVDILRPVDELIRATSRIPPLKGVAVSCFVPLKQGIQSFQPIRKSFKNTSSLQVDNLYTYIYIY